MGQAYSDPSRADDAFALPDVETMYWPNAVSVEDCNGETMIHEDISEAAGYDGDAWPLTIDKAPGWYYWTCLPGCLPDSDLFGPYDSEEEAIAAAQE